MRALKAVSVLLGVLVALAGAVSVASGGFVLSLYRSERAPSGFFATPTQTVGSNGFALTAPDINSQLESEWQRWFLARSQATVRVSASSQLPAAIFIGVGPTARVTSYLGGVARDRITSIDVGAGSVQYDHVDGVQLPAPPQEQDFWAATVVGTGDQTLEWRLRDGDWAVVIMNGDGSAPVVADVRLEARFGIVIPLIIALVAGGVVLLGIGATLLVLGARPRRAPPAYSGVPGGTRF